MNSCSHSWSPLPSCENTNPSPEHRTPNIEAPDVRSPLAPVEPTTRSGLSRASGLRSLERPQRRVVQTQGLHVPGAETPMAGTGSRDSVLRHQWSRRPDSVALQEVGLRQVFRCLGSRRRSDRGGRQRGRGTRRAAFRDRQAHGPDLAGADYSLSWL